jgi:hypothetical protein
MSFKCFIEEAKEPKYVNEAAKVKPYQYTGKELDLFDRSDIRLANFHIGQLVTSTRKVWEPPRKIGYIWWYYDYFTKETPDKDKISSNNGKPYYLYLIVNQDNTEDDIKRFLKSTTYKTKNVYAEFFLRPASVDEAKQYKFSGLEKDLFDRPRPPKFKVGEIVLDIFDKKCKVISVWSCKDWWEKFQFHPEDYDCKESNDHSWIYELKELRRPDKSTNPKADGWYESGIKKVTSVNEDYEKKHLFDTNPNKFREGDIVFINSKKRFPHLSGKRAIISLATTIPNVYFVEYEGQEYVFTGNELQAKKSLKEEYYDTFKLGILGKSQIIEVFKNPTQSELPLAKMDRAILDANGTLYVWSGLEPVLHKTIAHKIGINLKDTDNICLYLQRSAHEVQPEYINLGHAPSIETRNRNIKTLEENKNIKKFMGGKYEVYREDWLGIG